MQPMIAGRDSHTGRLGEQREIGGDAMGHEMARADTIARIFDALKFLDRALLDLADHGAERNVTVELDAGLDDCLDRDQRRGQTALHVVGAKAPNPTVSENRLGLESITREMLLVTRIRRIHMASEKEIEPLAASAQMADGVRPAFVDQRQIGD